MSAWSYPAHTNSQPEPSRRSMTCLIISDDVIMRNALADAIATEGAGSVAVEGLDDALTALEESGYPLIFAPQQSPGLSGSEICACLHSAAGGKNSWIVALPRMEMVSLRGLIANGFDGLLRAPFDPADIALLVAGAARNQRAAEQLTVAQSRAESLRGLATSLAGSATLDEQAALILKAATGVLLNSAAAIWLSNRDGDTLTCAGTLGLSDEYAQRGTALFPYLTPDRWLEIARQPLFVNAMTDAPRLFTDIARGEGFAASLTVVLMTPARVLGALAIYTREQTSPAGYDIELLETIAASASMAVDRFQVQQQHETLRSLIERLPDGVFLHDVNGNFLMANPALEELSGHGRGDLETLSIFDLLEEGRTGEVGQTLTRQFQSIDTHSSWRLNGPALVNLLRPDQRVIQAELFLRPVQSHPQSDDILIQGVLRDVTERERTRREFEALRIAAAVMATERDLDHIMSAIINTLREQAGYEHAAIWTLTHDNTELTLAAGDAGELAAVQVGDGPIGRAAATGEPVFLRGAQGPLTVVGQPVRSQICVPIVTEGRSSGVIDVTAGARRPLDEGDLAFLISLATHLASSVERSHLHHELQRQASIDSVTNLENRATFLKRLDNEMMNAGGDPVSLLIIGVDRFKGINDTYGHLIADEMLRQVGDTLNARVRSPQAIARYTSDQFAVLLPRTGRMSAPAVAENLRIGIATQLFMAAEQVEQMTVSVGAASYPNDAGDIDQLLLAASHAMYLAKQAGRNQVYQSNEAFAELASSHGRITDLLRQAPKETLALLVRAMDQRTLERAGHSQRVADYALALARELRLPEDELSALRIAAVIHDIGMFSLPDSLLRKPAGLSDSERELLYGIPINAHRLLSQVPLPDSVLPAVVHQHEHWDGSGFPSGLQGVAIPTGARIIAVADAIDAMTSERAHRESLSMDEALQALAGQAGSRFDPDVVRAAQSLLGELNDVSQDLAGSDLEATIIEVLAVIPQTERVMA
ncbi:hypothetical protein BH23CHL1_BH23CHL1_18940 [soil metagenome]